MKSRFRLYEKDEVKIEAVSNGKLLATVRDSGFGKVAQAVGAVLRKIPHFAGKTIEVRITNLTRDTYTYRYIATNR